MSGNEGFPDIYYLRVARGIDERPVRAHRERKCIGAPALDRTALAAISLGLLRDAFPLRRSVRLIGVALSSLEPIGDEGPRQLGLAV